MYSKEGMRHAFPDVIERDREHSVNGEHDPYFQRIVESLPVAVYTTDAEGHIQLFNEAAVSLWGRRPAAGVDKWCGWYRVFLPDGTPVPPDQCPMAIALKENRSVTGVELVIEQPDGERRTVLPNPVPLRDGEGRLSGAINVLIDVTDQKKSEIALRDSEERLMRSLVEVQDLNDTLEERVRKRTEQVRALASVLTLAEQRERKRISQVLHDDLQQMLYGQLMSIGVVRKTMSSIVMDGPAESVPEAIMAGQKRDGPLAKAQQLLGRIEEGIEQAIDATRTLAVELNPPILKSEGLVEALRWLGRHMESAYQVEITLDMDDAVAYPAGDTRTMLIQMIRELLFNVVKHAGKRRAHVSRQTSDSTLYVRVQDHGKGFDIQEIRNRQHDHGGYGLFSIEERLSLVGGSLEIQSEVDVGTTVSIGLPLEAGEGQ